MWRRCWLICHPAQHISGVLRGCMNCRALDLAHTRAGRREGAAAAGSMHAGPLPLTAGNLMRHRRPPTKSRARQSLAGDRRPACGLAGACEAAGMTCAVHFSTDCRDGAPTLLCAPAMSGGTAARGPQACGGCFSACICMFHACRHLFHVPIQLICATAGCATAVSDKPKSCTT